MKKKIITYFQNYEEAIKIAKKRATTQMATHYIYQDLDGFYIRGVPPAPGDIPLAKVLYGGEVQKLREPRS